MWMIGSVKDKGTQRQDGGNIAIYCLGKIRWKHLQTCKGMGLTVIRYAVVEGEEWRTLDRRKMWYWVIMEIQGLTVQELGKRPRENVLSQKSRSTMATAKVQQPLISSALWVSSSTSCQQSAQSSISPPLPSIVLHKHNHSLCLP